MISQIRSNQINRPLSVLSHTNKKKSSHNLWKVMENLTLHKSPSQRNPQSSSVKQLGFFLFFFPKFSESL